VIERADKASPRDEARQHTRERLLEVAGQMFASQGFEGTTGKQICQRAGVNPAAINYHFGGLEGLYEAVLSEARDRVVGREDRLFALLDGPLPPEQKLRAIITLVVGAVVASGRASWILRLISREVTNPSKVGGRFLAATARPRVERVRALVGELVGLPPDHPSVALACLSLAAPLQILLIADRDLVRTIHPALDLSPKGEAALVEHFYGFVMVGLQALRAGADE
jgi:AcrR family transcriptional regulator